MRYRAKIHPLHEGHRQQGKEFWGYTNASSVKQASLFLGRRYPYPSYLIEEPVVDHDKPPKKYIDGVPEDQVIDYSTWQWWKNLGRKDVKKITLSDWNAMSPSERDRFLETATPEQAAEVLIFLDIAKAPSVFRSREARTRQGRML